MSNDIQIKHTLPTSLRALLGFTAIATLFANAPWHQSSAFLIAIGYVGPLTWGLIALFGNKTGIPRHITAAFAVVYLVLVACKLLGIAT